LVMDNDWGRLGHGDEVCKQVGNPRGPDWGKLMTHLKDLTGAGFTR
jgi:hypothetical protein